MSKSVFIGTTMSIPSAIYDPILDMPICNSKKCGFAINAEHFRRHLRQVHELDAGALDSICTAIQREHADTASIQHNELKALYMATTDKKKPLQGPLRAHPNLNKFSAWQCSACNAIVGINNTTEPRHSCAHENVHSRSRTTGGGGSPGEEQDSVPKPKAVTNAKLYKITAQTVFGGKKKRPFRIITEDGDAGFPVLPQQYDALQKKAASSLDDEQDNIDNGKSQSKAGNATATTVDRLIAHTDRLDCTETTTFTSNIHPSDTDPIHTELLTEDLLKSYNLDMPKAAALVLQDNQSDSAFLYALLHKYMSAAYKEAKSNSYIKTHSFLGQEVRMNVNEGTLSEYTYRVCRLICFLRRAMLSDEYTMIQKNMSRALRDAVRTIDESLSLYTGQSALHINARDQPRWEVQEEEALVQAVHDILNNILFSTSEPQNKLTPLYIALCSVKAKPKDNNDGDAAAKRCGNAVVSTSYSMLSSTHLTHCMSSLLFLAKCYVVHDVYLIEKQVHGSADSIDMRREKRWEALLRKTSPSMDNGIRYVRNTLTMCHRINRAVTNMHERFNVCTDHSLCAYVDNVKVPVNKLTCAIIAMQNDIWSLLRTKLMLGLSLNADFWGKVANLDDAMRAKVANYWYGRHPKNAELSDMCRKRILQAVSCTPLRPTTQNNPDGTQTPLPTFPTQEAHTYIHYCTEFQRLLLTLIQLTSGAPARMPEIASVKLRNTNRCQRGLYITSGGFLTIVTSYHKSQKLHSGALRYIARFPDAVTSGIIIVYTMIVRPLEHLLCRQLFGASTAQLQDNKPSSKLPAQRGAPHSPSRRPDIVVNAATHATVPQPTEQAAPLVPDLFLYNGAPATPRQLATWFSSTMAAYDIDLNVSKYRHFHTGITNHFIDNPSPSLHSQQHDSPGRDEHENDDEDDGDGDGSDAGHGDGHGENNMGARRNSHQTQANNLGTMTEAGSVLHVQAGHSVNTAHRVYGRGAGDHSAMTTYELHSYKHGSYQHQQLLKLRHGPPCPLPTDYNVTTYNGTTLSKTSANQQRLEQQMLQQQQQQQHLPLQSASKNETLATTPVTAEKPDNSFQLHDENDADQGTTRGPTTSNYATGLETKIEKLEHKVDTLLDLLTKNLTDNDTRPHEVEPQFQLNPFPRDNHPIVQDGTATNDSPNEPPSTKLRPHRVTPEPLPHTSPSPVARKLSFEDNEADNAEATQSAAPEPELQLLLQKANSSSRHYELLERANREKRAHVECTEKTDDDIASKRQRTKGFFKEHDLTTALAAATNNKTAAFRSDDQLEAVNIATSAATNCLVIHPTGSGKSMTYILSGILHPAKTSILLCPLLALQHDIMRRCQAAGVDATTFDDRESCAARIVITAVEHTRNQAYSSYVRQLQSDGYLHCIFVEEAHLVLMAGCYRECMAEMHTNIIPEMEHKPPIIALTATCPPQLTDKMLESIGLSPDNTTISRAPSNRANISYLWLRIRLPLAAHSPIMVHKMNVIVSQMKAPPHRSMINKFIIYGPTKMRVETVSTEISQIAKLNRLPYEVHTYHADIPQEQAQKSLHRWLTTDEDDDIQVMCATNAFGCGIDCPTVRAVFHTDIPATFIDYAQESGRAGRDGLPSYSIVLSTNNTHSWRTRQLTAHNPNVPNYSQLPPVESTEKFAPCKVPDETDTVCRRYSLTAYLDGADNAVHCTTADVATADPQMLCDVCYRSNPRTASQILPLDTSLLSTDMPDGIDHPGSYHAAFSATPSNLSHPPPRARHPHDRQPPTWTPGTIVGPHPTSTQRKGSSTNSDGQTQQPFNTAAQKPRNPHVLSLQFNTPTQTQSGPTPQQPVSVARLSKIDTSASDFIAIAQLYKHACAPCSIKAHARVEHDTNERQSSRCFESRCFTCGSQTHTRQNKCAVNTWGYRTGTCRKCNLNSHNATWLHQTNSYGKPSCPYRNCIRFAMEVWYTEAPHHMLKQAVPELNNIFLEDEYLSFLVNYDSSTGKTFDSPTCGLAVVMNFIDSVFM